MDNLEMANYESGASTSGWYAWANKVEKILGHSLDGDQATDGYSIDEAYEYWEKIGFTPAEYASRVNDDKAELASKVVVA
jgi:hypothetical protein